ncbi:MAG: hypothetical protein K6G91_00250 [Kiritimatiellae bacterium]|nr:hypothetical protein [Kiritimatiellia bacterium]
MNQMSDACRLLPAIACCSSLLLVASCKKAEEIPSKTAGESRPHEKVESVIQPSCAVETNVVLTKSEAYEREFRRFALGEHMTVDDVEHGVNKVCNEIAKTGDSKEAVRLFDLLGEIALTQTLLNTNYYKRENHLLKLWYMTMNAFVFAQYRRQESFEDWDRLFLFFKRYTDEISDVEQRMKQPGKLNGRQRGELKSYLRALKGDLKQAIHVMRRFGFPYVNGKLTEEQKADIMRRFEEVEKCTTMPQGDF